MSGTQAHHAGGTRARIGRAATGVVSSAAQFGSDRADIADSMGHTAAEMAGRAGMYGMSSTMHGVGWTAGKARRIMNRGKRALRSGKGMRKTAGKPKALSEAKPSEKIGKFAAKAKASKRIGKHIGAALGTPAVASNGWDPPAWAGWTKPARGSPWLTTISRPSWEAPHAT